MARSSHHILFVLLVLVLGCSDRRTRPSDGGTPVDANPGVDAAPPPIDANVDAGASTTWTDTPYLSETQTLSFAAAGVGITPGTDYGARLVTDVGTIVVDLNEAESPLAVNSFAFLARNHFFDGTAFHRVIDGFVAQGGDPNSVSGAPGTWGYGGPGYQFANEDSPSLRFDAAGVLAMANGGRDTNGSQFFITFAPQPTLNGGYTIFGHVIEGASLYAAIVRGEPPAVPTRIMTVQIIER